MSVRRSRSLVAVTAATLVASIGSVAAIAAPAAREAAPAAAAKTATISGKGVGGVHVGATFASLRAAKLVGPLTGGCELAGSSAKSANLRAPLKGAVQLTTGSTRRVESIYLTRGATARGVGNGSTLAAVRSAFPNAKVSHKLEDTFGLTMVNVGKAAGGRFQFGVDTKTGKVTAIGVPFIPLCD
jgi:hypothetical protein